MDNQHRKIDGYRELSEKEIILINIVKRHGRELEDLLRALGAEDSDKRWLSIAKTHLQQGMMAMTRAIAKPKFF